jgi:hypothetical protein
MKTCKICKLTKLLTEFNPASKYKDKIYYRTECKSCNLALQSSSQASQIKYRNSEKGSAAKKAYKQTDKYKKQQLQYEKDRRLRDNLYRCRKNLRDRLNKALKVKNWSKDTHFSEYIGCEQNELIGFLESKFSLEMSWENYGKIWQIDHIIPLASAQTLEEMYTLCHYTNLSPILIEEHKIKSSIDTKNIILRKKVV